MNTIVLIQGTRIGFSESAKSYLTTGLLRIKFFFNWKKKAIQNLMSKINVLKVLSPKLWN